MKKDDILNDVYILAEDIAEQYGVPYDFYGNELPDEIIELINILENLEDEAYLKKIEDVCVVFKDCIQKPNDKILA